MSELELAAELAGAFLLGAITSVAAVYLYARKLFRDRFGKAAAALMNLPGSEAPGP